MIGIVDYGVGNLFSLSASLARLDLSCIITGDPQKLREADRVILPGVGAFGDAMEKLRPLIPELDRLVAEGKPLLGICLGMQLLFDSSAEYGKWDGLGYLKGTVQPLRDDLPCELKVPHIGWNALMKLREEDPLLRYTHEGEHFYYVHSYYAKGCGESLLAVSEYGVSVPGVVRRNNVCGTQFHPEKSGPAGLRLLKAFADL